MPNQHTPKLPDTVRATDAAKVAALKAVAQSVAAEQKYGRLRTEAMKERNRRMTVAAQVKGVSWADLARVAGISDVSVMQAVERYERENPGYSTAI